MQPFQQRVVDEKSALDEKIAALDAFIGTTTFYSLPDDEHMRLSLQLSYMRNYSLILGMRIEAFT